MRRSIRHSATASTKIPPILPLPQPPPTGGGGKPIAASPGGDLAADGPVLVGVLCPGDELAVDALAEIALAAACTGRRTSSMPTKHASVRPAASASRSSSRTSRPTCCCPPTISAVPGSPPPRCCTASAVTPRALLRDGEYDLVLRCAEQADVDPPRAEAAGAARRRTRWTTTPRPRGTRRAPPRAAASAPRCWMAACPAPGACSACIARHRQGRHHHPDLRRARLYRDLHPHAARQDRLSELRDRLHRQHPGTARCRGRSGCSRTPTVSSTFRSHSTGRASTTCAAAATDSDYLLFLNDDIEITQDDWLDALLEHAQRPEVGVVGPQLLYPSGKVQHAGMFLGAGHRPPCLPLRRRPTSRAISAWR